jgi:hypothetical protein
MNMSRLSVPEAAERLGISPIRVRQRLGDGSLIGEKVGGRWLVDLSAIPRTKPRGRPVKPEAIWDTIRRVDAAQRMRLEGGPSFNECLRLVYSEAWRPAAGASYEPDLVLSDGSVVEVEVSSSTRRRALQRLLRAARPADGERGGASAEALMHWLGGRAERRLYRVAAPDAEGLRVDPLIMPSGLSDPRSGMQDMRVIEGYVASSDLSDVVADRWLDPPGVDAAPNVFLHVAPGRPDTVSRLMLAADLFEHQGPRERARAIELAEELFA